MIFAIVATAPTLRYFLVENADPKPDAYGLVFAPELVFNLGQARQFIDHGADDRRVFGRGRSVGLEMVRMQWNGNVICHAACSDAGI